MVWNGGMVWRGIDCVDGGHCTGRKTTSLCDRRHSHDCAHCDDGSPAMKSITRSWVGLFCSVTLHVAEHLFVFFSSQKKPPKTPMQQKNTLHPRLPPHLPTKNHSLPLQATSPSLPTYLPLPSPTSPPTPASPPSLSTTSLIADLQSIVCLLPLQSSSSAQTPLSIRSVSNRQLQSVIL